MVQVCEGMIKACKNGVWLSIGPGEAFSGQAHFFEIETKVVYCVIQGVGKGKVKGLVVSFSSNPGEIEITNDKPRSFNERLKMNKITKKKSSLGDRTVHKHY
jgi:hypothetical protein